MKTFFLPIEAADKDAESKMYQGITLQKTTYRLPCMATEARANTTLPESISTIFLGEKDIKTAWVQPTTSQHSEAPFTSLSRALFCLTLEQKKKPHTHTLRDLKKLCHPGPAGSFAFQSCKTRWRSLDLNGWRGILEDQMSRHMERFELRPEARRMRSRIKRRVAARTGKKDGLRRGLREGHGSGSARVQCRRLWERGKSTWRAKPHEGRRVHLGRRRRRQSSRQACHVRQGGR